MVGDKPKVRIIIILVLALTTSGLVYSYLKGLDETGLDETSVVVASQKVEEGTKLTPDMLKEVRMPLKYVHPGAVTASSSALDHYTTVDLWPDQVVIGEQLVTAQTSNEMNYKIPAGRRAITIEISQVSGVAGYIKPGNYIDMVISFKPEPDQKITQTLTLLQNIEVLAVGSQLEDKKEAPAADTITLAVTPQEAQLVMLAENTGKIKLTLRPADEKDNVPMGAVNHPGLMSQYSW